MLAVTFEAIPFSKFATLAAACAAHIAVRMAPGRQNQFVEDARELGLDLCQVPSALQRQGFMNGPVDASITRDQNLYCGSGHTKSPLNMTTFIKNARTIGWKLDWPMNDVHRQWWCIRLHQVRIVAC
jgi:hypothetical protein